MPDQAESDSVLSHPQSQELREKLTRFFAAPPDATWTIDDPKGTLAYEAETLIVHDPVSLGEVGFSHEIDYTRDGRIERSSWMSFRWPAAGRRERAIAKRLGLQAPRARKRTVSFPFKPGPAFEVTEIPGRGRVEGPDHAVKLCLTVIREVFGIPANRWLWISDLGPNPDQWPAPLPTPEVWPPGARSIPPLS